MLPKRLLTGVDWHRRTEPDTLPELMDEPCAYEELRACLHDLEQVNRLTFGYRPTLEFLNTLVAKHRPQTPLRVLDVGFGGGDTLRRIARWSKSKKLPVELIGIDLNPFAARIAAESTPGGKIQWLTGDALVYTGKADVILSSLLTHHLPLETVVRFLRWMEQTARIGWFINDLERSERSAKLFALLARALRWHRFVQHDGPVSFARAFRTADWQQMLAESGLPPRTAELKRSFPARLCVSRLR